MESTNFAYRCHLSTHLPQLRRDPDIQQRLAVLAEPIEALRLLDLEPARPMLLRGYAPKSRGRRPTDPLILLRSLVLMLLCKLTSINRWVEELKGKAELRVLSGLLPNGKPPGVGTFYDFLERLLNGPYQPRCAHHHPPAEHVHGRGFRRHLEQERAAQQAQTQAEWVATHQGRAAQEVKDALARRSQPEPQDLEQRLNELLMCCAVIPSIGRGLLGDIRHLDIAGDGTALPSAGDGHGHADCDCKAQGISDCACPRYYSDPDAQWGYDSSLEIFFFGYRMHAIVTRPVGFDLPLRVSMSTGNTPDVVMGIHALTRLHARLQQPDVNGHIDHACWDAGYDATAFYELHRRLGIIPLIPLAQPTKTLTCAQGFDRNDEGTPLCPARLPMRLHQRGRDELVYSCPVKRPTHLKGKYVYQAHPEDCPHKSLCQPDSVMGPLVHIRLDGDPRMNLPIPRDSALFAQLYKSRTTTERFNFTTKSSEGMIRGAYRRLHVLFSAVVAHAIGVHAKAWVRHQAKTLDGASSKTRGPAVQAPQMAA